MDTNFADAGQLVPALEQALDHLPRGALPTLIGDLALPPGYDAGLSEEQLVHVLRLVGVRLVPGARMIQPRTGPNAGCEDYRPEAGEERSGARIFGVARG
jgi:hypothetical protein